MTWEELKEKAKGIGYVVIKTCLGGESLSKGSFYFTEHGEYYIEIDGYTTYGLARDLKPDQIWQIMEALK